MIALPHCLVRWWRVKEHLVQIFALLHLECACCQELVAQLFYLVSLAMDLDGVDMGTLSCARIFVLAILECFMPLHVQLDCLLVDRRELAPILSDLRKVLDESEASFARVRRPTA